MTDTHKIMLSILIQRFYLLSLRDLLTVWQADVIEWLTLASCNVGLEWSTVCGYTTHKHAFQWKQRNWKMCYFVSVCVYTALLVAVANDAHTHTQSRWRLGFSSFYIATHRHLFMGTDEMNFLASQFTTTECAVDAVSVYMCVIFHHIWLWKYLQRQTNSLGSVLVLMFRYVRTFNVSINIGIRHIWMLVHRFRFLHMWLQWTQWYMILNRVTSCCERKDDTIGF